MNFLFLFLPFPSESKTTGLGRAEFCFLFGCGCSWLFPLDRTDHCLPLGIFTYVAAAVKSFQSCLCDPIDSSPPGYPVPGILQARTREWVAISFSNVWKWKVKVKLLSHVLLFCNPMMDCSSPSSSVHGISRKENWSGLPFPSPSYFSNQVIFLTNIQFPLFLIHLCMKNVKYT